MNRRGKIKRRNRIERKKNTAIGENVGAEVLSMFGRRRKGQTSFDERAPEERRGQERCKSRHFGMLAQARKLIGLGDLIKALRI